MRKNVSDLAERKKKRQSQIGTFNLELVVVVADYFKHRKLL